MKKKLIVAVATLVTAGVTGAAGLGAVSAQTSQTTGSTLVDKIAQKFNLNKDDVQKVFDEEHIAREAERQQLVSDKIDQAVKDGKISQSLADQLKTKLKELDAYHDTLKDKTGEERRTAMKAKMDEFKNWAEDNGISHELTRPGGHGRGGFKGAKGSSPSDSTSTIN